MRSDTVIPSGLLIGNIEVETVCICFVTVSHFSKFQCKVVALNCHFLVVLLVRLNRNGLTILGNIKSVFVSVLSCVGKQRSTLQCTDVNGSVVGILHTFLTVNTNKVCKRLFHPLVKSKLSTFLVFLKPSQERFLCVNIRTKIGGVCQGSLCKLVLNSFGKISDKTKVSTTKNIVKRLSTLPAQEHTFTDFFGKCIKCTGYFGSYLSSLLISVNCGLPFNCCLRVLSYSNESIVSLVHKLDCCLSVFKCSAFFKFASKPILNTVNNVLTVSSLTLNVVHCVVKFSKRSGFGPNSNRSHHLSDKRPRHLSSASNLNLPRNRQLVDDFLAYKSTNRRHRSNHRLTDLRLCYLSCESSLKRNAILGGLRCSLSNFSRMYINIRSCSFFFNFSNLKSRNVDCCFFDTSDYFKVFCNIVRD